MPERSAAQPTRVAVTGGAGFIGSHTVELLVERGKEVLVIDDYSHPCPEPLPSVVNVVHADAGSSGAAAALRAFGPDAVLHLATKGGVVRSLRDPAAHLEVSLVKSVALFQAAIAAGAKSIVAASSGGTIYGVAQHLPASEDEPVQPVSPYGASKAAEEVYLAALGRLAGIRTLSVRYGNVYGPRQDGTGEAGLVAITSNRLLQGEAPIVYGDGKQTRDFVFVRDVARANVAALDSHVAGVVNVGTGRETSVEEIVQGLSRESEMAAPPPEYMEARPGEVRRVCLDPALARRSLGWEPEVQVAEGLKLTYRYFEKRLLAASREG